MLPLNHHVHDKEFVMELLQHAVVIIVQVFQVTRHVKDVHLRQDLLHHLQSIDGVIILVIVLKHIRVALVFVMKPMNLWVSLIVNVKMVTKHYQMLNKMRVAANQSIILVRVRSGA